MATIIEIMKAAEDNIQSIMQHKDNNFLRMFMNAAFLPDAKLKLPETHPPFSPNKMEEAAVPPGVFWQFARRIDMFQKEYTGAAKARTETAFIQALESVSAKEAELILACKDQTVARIYKGITFEALKNVGYFQ
jgi:hypothetical protein